MTVTAASSELTLYVEPKYISPYVFACFVTLNEKALPFAMRPLDTASGDTKRDEYLSRTITGRVPSLVHGDFALAESSAIVEYLDEAFPAVPIFPKELRARARARQIMSWLRSDDTAIIREERPTTSMFYAPATAALSAKARIAADKLVRVAERLLEGGASHLFGAWSLADAELAFMLHRLILNGDSVPAALKTWAETEWRRPSVAKFVALERPPA